MFERDQKEKILDLLDSFISLELSLSDLYFYYYKTLKEDSMFWWTICLEEKNHASLLESGKVFLQEKDTFPEELLPLDKDSINDVLIKIKQKVEFYQKNPPSRKEALEFALELESESGEKHFQIAMKQKAQSKILSIFQKLNQFNIDHGKRIYSYLKTQNL